jgi:hypothetical protein
MPLGYLQQKLRLGLLKKDITAKAVTRQQVRMKVLPSQKFVLICGLLNRNAMASPVA